MQIKFLLISQIYKKLNNTMLQGYEESSSLIYSVEVQNWVYLEKDLTIVRKVYK